MMTQDKIKPPNPLFLSCSHLTTESNKTGSWRFLRPRYDEKTAPCSAACPAGEDIGRIEMLTAQGLFKEAWETILKENPFPLVCGSVCYHPCEKVCNRGGFDEAVAIHTIERFLADTAGRYDLKPTLERLPSKKQKVAVVGAGPAGLSAAYFLTRLGYTCDVFEAASEPGGVLRWGIPRYRLPVANLRREIGQIESTGFEIRCGKPVSKRFLEEAKGAYNAVFLGCGYSRTPRLNIPGEDLEGITDGLSFLRNIAQGKAPSIREEALIIGGGNTAIDVARSVLRLGGRPILVYRRRRQDMPAFEDEIRMALEEGVEIRELWTPGGIERDGDGYLVRLQRMCITDTNPDGRACVEPDLHKTEVLRVRHVFKAIGAEASEPWYHPPEAGEGILRLSRSVLVHSDGAPTIVFGGDLATDVKSVVHAVASGKEAAMALDTLFAEGTEAILPKLRSCAVGGGPSLSMEIYMQGPRCRRNTHVVAYHEINTDHFNFAHRIVQPRLLKEERIESFAEIDLRISANLAIREAERCFNCGLCNQCDNCRLFCPDLAVVREDSPRGRRIDYDYCKGCGICVVECPRNAMVLEEEQV